MSGSYTIGYLMDYNHKRTERDYCRKNNLPFETLASQPKPTQTSPSSTLACATPGGSPRSSSSAPPFTAGPCYTHLAVPVILQYIIAYCATAIFTINSALIIDMYPGASASATAVNNFIRCVVGAGGVALVTPIINAVGSLYTFVLLAGITLAMVPL